MPKTTEDPAPLAAAAGLRDSFCLGAERPEDSRTAAHLQGNVLETRAALLRDFVFDALAPIEHDSAAARHCLANDEDARTLPKIELFCRGAPRPGWAAWGNEALGEQLLGSAEGGRKR
jgi:hypothetical protein